MTVFSDPYTCASHQSFGYSGMNMLLAAVTLGTWPVVSIFGVPTDWARAHAELSIAVLDPVSEVELARFVSGEVNELGYAGLYYAGSPLANSFARAAELLLEALERELPAVEKRMELARSPRSLEESLAFNDPIVRARALLAIAREKDQSRIAAVALRATDEHPEVRRRAAESLKALDARDPQARGALELLAKDPDPHVSAAADRALRALRFRTFAESTSNARCSALITALESLDTRMNALSRAARGTTKNTAQRTKEGTTDSAGAARQRPAGGGVRRRGDDPENERTRRHDRNPRCAAHAHRRISGRAERGDQTRARALEARQLSRLRR
jgi:hypothetical protein